MVWVLLLSVALLPGDGHGQGVDDTLSVDTDAALRRVLASAEDLLAENRAHAAYELLAPHEASYAGNPLYDYLLGVAALDSGRTGDAIFSLQRALAVAPGFSGARLELARAYFDAGQRERARPLFERTLAEQPPPAVHDVIVRYLLAIDAAPPVPRRRVLAYAEFFAGHDSNANGSTDDREFLGFTLNPDNVETSSPFAEAALGVDWLLPQSNRLGWQLGVRASHRRNPDAGFVDATFVSADAGLNWRRRTFFGGVSIGGYHGARDGDSNQSFAGASLLIGSRVAERWDLSLDVEAGAQRHDDSIEVLDVDRLMAALSLSRRYTNGGRISLALLGGEERERLDTSPYGNSKQGVRLGASLPFGHAARFASSVGVLTSDFDGTFFGAEREDTQLQAMLQIEFRDVLADGLSLSPRVRFFDNDSDIALYDYDRIEIGVGLKWTRQ